MSLSPFHRFEANPKNFLARSVTRAETWVYHYDPGTKQQSLRRMNVGKRSPVTPDLVFWDTGIVNFNYSPFHIDVNNSFQISHCTIKMDALSCYKCQGVVQWRVFKNLTVRQAILILIMEGSKKCLQKTLCIKMS